MFDADIISALGTLGYNATVDDDGNFTVKRDPELTIGSSHQDTAKKFDAIFEGTSPADSRLAFAKGATIAGGAILGLGAISAFFNRGNAQDSQPSEGEQKPKSKWPQIVAMIGGLAAAIGGISWAAMVRSQRATQQQGNGPAIN